MDTLIAWPSYVSRVRLAVERISVKKRLSFYGFVVILALIISLCDWYYGLLFKSCSLNLSGLSLLVVLILGIYVELGTQSLFNERYF